MAYTAYLERGGRKLSLDALPYALAQGFVPPAVTEAANIATGTSANVSGNGRLVDKRAVPSAYGFSVRVKGSSNAQIEAAIDRLDQFVRSGTEAEPVYFCWRATANIAYEPLYGQWNATRRAKVINGNVYKSANLYSLADVRSSVIFADVSLTITTPEGRRQRVATATGGIYEDTIGTPDGISRGVIIPEATTNVITNPIFGNATALTNWTTGGDTLSEVVTDTDFVLFGTNAVKLIRKTSGSTFSFYQSLNVGNTNTWCLSCYVKKPDSSAVTSSDIQLRYGGTTSAPSFMAVGNGWYRAWKTFTGIASSQVTGCTPILAGATIYVDGWQLEEKAYPTPLAYGDLLGCAWSSTVHASSTTRTAASLKIPASECVPAADFTWWIAFRANNTFSELSGNTYLLYEQATNANINIATTGQISFSDGTNGANGAATAITAGTIVIVHATMTSAGLKLYRNGAQDGSTQATFAPLASPSYLWVGTSDTTTAHSNVTILGAGTYKRGMTAAEIALDYANLYRQATGGDGYGQRCDWLPWLWTKDGDDVVDNYTLSTTHQCYAAIGDIPGNLDAVTEFDFKLSTYLDSNSQGAALFSLLDVPQNFSHAAIQTMFYDLSGTAVASTVGGSVETVTLAAVPNSTGGVVTILDYTLYRQLKRGFYLIGMANDNASDTISFAVAVGTNLSADEVISEYATSYSFSNYRNVLFGYSQAEEISDVSRYIGGSVSFVRVIYPFMKHASGTTSVYIDYMQLMPRPFMRIFSTNVSAGTEKGVYHSVRGVHGIIFGAAPAGETKSVFMSGDKIEFMPEKQNYLISSIGDIYRTPAAMDITNTLTYVRTYVTPRWSLA